MARPVTAAPEGPAIGRVPEEIWREIFRRCANARAEPATFNPLEVPILLTHVCAQWRLIAHDEEHLWTSLRARYPSPKLDEWRLQHLCDWLHRAKHKEVSLHLEQSYGLSEVSALFQLDAPCQRFMPQVAQSIKNLTSLVLVEIPQGELGFLPYDSFPVLESLVVPTKYWDHGRIQAFSDAPALRRVALEPQIADPAYMPIPWNQLTHFLEFWDTEKRTWERIEQMSHIRYLVIISPRCKEWVWHGPHGRVVDSLESLTVNLWDYDKGHGFQPEGLDFLDRFAFPNLRSLRLVLQDELKLISILYSDLIDQFLDGLQRYTGLEYFSLSCSNVTTIDRLFEAIPSVKTLDIHLRNQNPKDLGSLFEALTIVNDGPFQQHPLPQLKEIVVDLSTKNLCRNHRFTASELTCSEMITLTLRNFLSSRLMAAEAVGCDFKIVIYGTDATLIESYASTVDDLVKAGLQLEVNILPSDTEDHECKCARWWMYRDPELKNWREALEMARAPSF